MTTLREAEQAVISAALDVDMARMLAVLSGDPVTMMKGVLNRMHDAIGTLVGEHGDGDSSFAVDWEIGCAYAAGRRSVIESEEMEVVRDGARYALSDCGKNKCPQCAAIRAALEVLKP